VAIELHRCTAHWGRVFHACWRVEKALRDVGVEYELVEGTPNRFNRNARLELIAKTGQNVFPTIVFEDGSFYREESRDMAKTIRAGKLSEHAGRPARPAPDAR